MPLDFDPIYYTETMVRILREQGSPQLAMELAEIILQRQPENAAVAKLLQELKDEARLAFERFKNSGKAEPRSEAQASPSSESEVEESPLEPPREELEAFGTVDVPTDPSPAKAPELTLVQGGSSESSREKKVRRLQNLLERIQRRRGSHEAFPS